MGVKHTIAAESQLKFRISEPILSSRTLGGAFMKKRNLLVAAFALCFWPYHQPYYLFPTHWQGLSIYFHPTGPCYGVGCPGGTGARH